MGPPEAGKTCLQRALRHLPFTHQQQTHGLELHDILLPGCTLAHREVSLCLFSSPSVPLFLLTSCTLQTDLTLRVLDTGGQPAYHFLKPVVMRDRAVVLVCFRGSCDPNTAHNLREDLDTLSSVMDGGVVLLVATQLDRIGVTPRELRDVDGDVSALSASHPQVQALRSLWEGQLVPLCSRFAASLRIDTRFLAVSSVEGFELTLDLLRQRLRENVEQVSSSPSSFRIPFLISKWK